MDSAPLVGVKAIADSSWSSVNVMSSTTASPTYPRGIDITVYQITYSRTKSSC